MTLRPLVRSVATIRIRPSPALAIHRILLARPVVCCGARSGQPNGTATIVCRSEVKCGVGLVGSLNPVRAQVGNAVLLGSGHVQDAAAVGGVEACGPPGVLLVAPCAEVMELRGELPEVQAEHSRTIAAMQPRYLRGCGAMTSIRLRSSLRCWQRRQR